VRVSYLDDRTEARWDAFVEACPTATFFHRAGWKTAIERSFGHRGHFLYAEADGQIRGVLPLVHVHSRLFGNALISNAFCVYGGVASETGGAQRALDARALELAHSLGVDYLEYRSRSPVHADWACNADLYATFRKQISQDPEENLRAIPRKQRAMVRKGIKAGLKSEQDADVDRLYRLYAESVRNLGTPVLAKKYFRNLKQVFGDACEVLTVTREGTPLGSVMSFYFRDEVLPYYGGGSAAARDVAANDFMYWELMRRAGGRGYRIFDFGRSKRGTGSFAFKTHWGFEPRPLHYEYKLLRANEMPAINPLNPKYRAFIALWRRLPLAVANLVGPLIARDLA
jgi:FemAB-related protein (PEP-CTERM system-associated)